MKNASLALFDTGDRRCLPLLPEGFFPAAQFSPQTTAKKPLAPRVVAVLNWIFFSISAISS